MFTYLMPLRTEATTEEKTNTCRQRTDAIRVPAYRLTARPNRLSTMEVGEEADYIPIATLSPPE